MIVADIEYRSCLYVHVDSSLRIDPSDQGGRHQPYRYPADDGSIVGTGFDLYYRQVRSTSYIL